MNNSEKPGILLSITELQGAWEGLKVATQKAYDRIAEHEEAIAEERAHIETLGLKLADLNEGLAILIRNQNR